jgi:hypothetical protein
MAAALGAVSESCDKFPVVPDEPQTLPCRCGDTLDLFSSSQEDDTGVTTYWYLCQGCATRIEVQVDRLPDEARSEDASMAYDQHRVPAAA